MLGGNHTAQITLTEPVRQPTTSRQNVIIKLIGRVYARHPLQGFGGASGHRQTAFSQWGRKISGVHINLQSQGVDGQRVTLMINGTHENTLVFQHLGCSVKQVNGQTRRQQHLAAQGGGCPPVKPTGVLSVGQFIKVALFTQAQKHRPGRALSHAG